MDPAEGGAEPAGSAFLLQFRNLSKTFGGEHALEGVDFDVSPGEVHGLLGQNGSGKSTLIKVLAGYHAPEPGGRLWIGGKRVPLPLAPGGFRRHGVAFVHQHLGLIPALTVVENLYIGDLATRARWLISWHDMRRRAARLFEEFGLDIDPSEVVRRLSPVKRALLAIVRAVAEMRAAAGGNEGGLLVLDEPTPFLPRSDVEQLFRLVRDIVRRGASVVFVSHDVDEVLEITDRATVLRDGKVVGTLVTGRSTKEDFVEMIVGRKVSFGHTAGRDLGRHSADVAIEGLTGGVVADVSIVLRRGEVVGLTGLIGSGFDDVPYMVFGAAPTESGRLTLADRHFVIGELDPARAIAAGIVLIPGDRQTAGAIGSLTVADNVTMPVLGTEYRPWLLNRRGMVQRAGRLAQAFEVRPSNPVLTFDALSGGNQQKALLAKWMQTAPALILLDEPTQGVDVGARQTVFDAISRMTDAGAGVLCASSDYEQLAIICDRVLVFSRGRVVSELTGEAVTKDAIAEHCYRSVGGALATDNAVGERA